jgi:hypothetical protein
MKFSCLKDDSSDEETYLKREMDDSISEAWLNVSSERGLHVFHLQLVMLNRCELTSRLQLFMINSRGKHEGSAVKSQNCLPLNTAEVCVCVCASCFLITRSEIMK